MKKILLIFIIAMLTFSCEKDDICDASTPTTPRLIIKFYDIQNPATVRSVLNLKITSLVNGVEKAIIFDKTNTDILNDTIVALPLKINENLTKYKFIFNSKAENPSLISEDNLTFNYARKDEFVSRACGFKTLFEMNAGNQNSVILNENPGITSGNWIKDLQITQAKIYTENETHIKIFF
ncbi:MAG: hypothetical protein H7250_11825 [Flavobacterium sp.]|nr:hypothetical protein [Flavobacterium sp.]